TANLATRRPLVLVLDELHWSDLPSLRWLAYLLPRMEGLPVLVVGGLRPEERGEDAALLAQILSDPMAVVSRPAPLSVEVATVFLRERLSAGADEAFCAACHAETGGNPLLLRELVRAIADEGLVPTAANVPRLHPLAARAGSRPVSLRLSRLPAAATALARAVAYLRRALAEPRGPEERADLLLELGSAETQVDGDAAIQHLQEAHELSATPIERARVALLLGRQLFLLRGDEADAVFIEALDE